MKAEARFFAVSAIMKFSGGTQWSARVLAIMLLGASGVCVARNTSSNSCVSFAEASKYVGTSGCVRGTVLRVEDGRNGAKILNFCKEKSCPFSVVVFAADLKKMGDVQQLEGKQLEIKGTIQDYEGLTEIVLRRSQQLGEGAFLLFPQVPTDYDVERAGHSSAGSMKKPKAAKKKET
jgi:DNA/RNA endonuclease YhcR with UshA esterase domain